MVAAVVDLAAKKYTNLSKNLRAAGRPPGFSAARTAQKGRKGSLTCLQTSDKCPSHHRFSSSLHMLMAHSWPLLHHPHILAVIENDCPVGFYTSKRIKSVKAVP